jgi:hypothetical protein
MTRQTIVFALAGALSLSFASPGAAQLMFRPNAFQPNDVPVRLQGEPGLTLHVLEGTSSAVAYGSGGQMAVAYGYNYRMLCASPCETTVPRGAHALGLSRTPADQPGLVGTYVFEGPTTFEASYRSRSTIRLAGWLTWVIGVLAGGALAVTSIFTGPEQCDSYGYCDNTVNIPLLVTGSVLGGASMIAGLIMTNFRDVAILTPVE